MGYFKEVLIKTMDGTGDKCRDCVFEEEIFEGYYCCGLTRYEKEVWGKILNISPCSATAEEVRYFNKIKNKRETAFMVTITE